MKRSRDLSYLYDWKNTKYLICSQSICRFIPNFNEILILILNMQSIYFVCNLLKKIQVGFARCKFIQDTKSYQYCVLEDKVNTYKLVIQQTMRKLLILNFIHNDYVQITYQVQLLLAI